MTVSSLGMIISSLEMKKFVLLFSFPDFSGSSAI